MKKIFRYTLLLIGLLLLIGWIVTTFFPEKLVPMMLQQQLKRQIAQVEKNNQLLQDDESIYVLCVYGWNICSIARRTGTNGNSRHR